MKSYKEEIKRVLGNAPNPLHIERIRTRAGIGGWNTALKHCLEMYMAGDIKGRKTSHGWVFWVPKEGGLEIPELTPTGREVG